MRYINSIKRLLVRKARPLTLVMDGVGSTIHAVLQPMRYKNKMYLDSNNTKLGMVDESCFLLIGPPEAKLYENRNFVVDENGRLYSIVKSERVFLLDKPAYTWAIMRIWSN